MKLTARALSLAVMDLKSGLVSATLCAAAFVLVRLATATLVVLLLSG